jgi:hypothetical protein
MSRNRIGAAAAVYVAVLSGVAFAQADGDVPIETTVCELVKEPARFNGKPVKVAAKVDTAEEASVIFDEQCSASVLFVADPTLAHDKNYRNLEHLLSRRHSVVVTVVGQFQSKNDGSGFGHQNAFRSRLVVQSILDIKDTLRK